MHLVKANMIVLDHGEHMRIRSNVRHQQDQRILCWHAWEILDEVSE